MKILVIFVASMLSIAASAARAETTCESVRTDLTGANVYGKHTIEQLSEQTREGSCTAAAYLSRRAKDAQGFVETHCPGETALRSMATDLVGLAQNTLQTPECRD